MNTIKFNEGATVSIDEVELEKAVKTYNGKAGRCCCGCAGKYAYTEEGAKAASYEVDVKPRSVKATVNKINAAIRGEFAIDMLITDKNFVSIEVNERMYTVYFS